MVGTGEAGEAVEVDQEVLAKDPTGGRRWERVCELGAMVATGINIRLLCHCRWTRREEAGCLECHCEPTAAHIEQQARRARAETRAGAATAESDKGGEEAGRQESAGRAGGGNEERSAGGFEARPAARRRSWQEMSDGRREDGAQQKVARRPAARAEPTASATTTSMAAAAREGEGAEGGDGRRQAHWGPTGNREAPSTRRDHHDIDTVRHEDTQIEAGGQRQRRRDGRRTRRQMQPRRQRRTRETAQDQKKTRGRWRSKRPKPAWRHQRRPGERNSPQARESGRRNASAIPRKRGRGGRH